MRNLALLVIGVLGLWALLFWPARAIWGEDAVLFSSAAAVICLVPAALTLVWCQKSLAGTPEQRLAAVMGGTMARMFVAVGAGVLLFFAVQAFHEPAFLIWVLVFYLATLALEVGLVVKEMSAANPPQQHQEQA
jgi:hypothetical protein